MMLVCMARVAETVCNSLANPAFLLLLSLPQMSASHAVDTPSWYCVALVRIPNPCASESFDVLTETFASTDGKKAALL
jgi:hypothetical protein